MPLPSHMQRIMDEDFPGARHVLETHGFDPGRSSYPNGASAGTLKAIRADLHRTRNAISEHRTKAGGNYTEEETAALAWIGRNVTSLSSAIDTIEAEPTVAEQAALRSSGRTASRDGPANALAPGDRVEDYVAQSVGDYAGANVGIGQLLRNHIRGTSSGDHAQQGEGTGSLGGFMVPAQLSARIIDLARNQARVVQAGAMTIPIVGPTNFATVEQDPVAKVKAENAEIEGSEVLLGNRLFDPVTLAVLVCASVELIEDAPNVERVIEESIGSALALELDRMCLFGTGVGQALGLYNLTGAGGTPATNRIPLAGPLEDYSQLSLAVQAVRDENAEPGAFLMSARTSGELDRLVDEDGNPMRPPRSVAEREQLVTNQIPNDLSNPTASPPLTDASAIFTGQWGDFYIALRTSMTIEATRVGGDAFKKMQVLIRGYLRADAFAVRPRHFAIVDFVTPPAE